MAGLPWLSWPCTHRHSRFAVQHRSRTPGQLFKTLPYPYCTYHLISPVLSSVAYVVLSMPWQTWTEHFQIDMSYAACAEVGMISACLPLSWGRTLSVYLGGSVA